MIITQLAPDGRRSTPRPEREECPRCRLVRKLLAEQQDHLDHELWKMEIGMVGFLLHWITSGWWTRVVLNKPEPKRQ